VHLGRGSREAGQISIPSRQHLYIGLLLCALSGRRFKGVCGFLKLLVCGFLKLLAYT